MNAFWIPLMMVALSALAPAQAPATDVFLAPILPAGSATAIGPWANISNNTGYDNQPSFQPDSRALLFSSNRDGRQTDIYRYEIGTQALTQVTRTPESEYSPTVTPDGRTFSVIQVEADNTQRLWRFESDGLRPRVVLESVKPVGYHAWIDDTRLALFVLGASGSPSTLQLANTTTGAAVVVATGIGRSVLIRPGRGTVSFMTTEAPRMLHELDPQTGAVSPLVAPIDGSQDAAWMPDGRLLMGRGTAISVWSPGVEGWTLFADLASPVFATGAVPPVASVTRLAVSPDGRWLAFVAEPRAR
jgi:WD40 repeat protein